MSGPDDMGLGAYPRPQLVRDAWTDLNGLWEFSYDDNDEGERERWYRPGSPTFAREILVPFPPESSASGVGDTGPHSVVWYRRGFVAPEVGTSQRVILHFGAVDYRANVWVNGEHVGYHEGGHTPFVCDVTLALRGTGGESVIVVRAEDRPEDLSQPARETVLDREAAADLVRQDKRYLAGCMAGGRTGLVYQQSPLGP